MPSSSEASVGARAPGALEPPPQLETTARVAEHSTKEQRTGPYKSRFAAPFNPIPLELFLARDVEVRAQPVQRLLDEIAVFLVERTGSGPMKRVM